MNAAPRQEEDDMKQQRRSRAYDITEFLLARIAEDEVAAGNAAQPRGAYQHAVEDGYSVGLAPYRMLADCQAKRAIIGLHTYEWMGPDDAAGKGCEHDYEDWPCPTLRHLADVYADHPDYRQEWRP